MNTTQRIPRPDATVGVRPSPKAVKPSSAWCRWRVDRCSGTGYRSRMGLHDILRLPRRDPRIRTDPSARSFCTGPRWRPANDLLRRRPRDDANGRERPRDEPQRHERSDEGLRRRRAVRRTERIGWEGDRDDRGTHVGNVPRGRRWARRHHRIRKSRYLLDHRRRDRSDVLDVRISDRGYRGRGCCRRQAFERSKEYTATNLISEANLQGGTEDGDGTEGSSNSVDPRGRARTTQARQDQPVAPPTAPGKGRSTAWTAARVPDRRRR
jgi:hypothetical protein